VRQIALNYKPHRQEFIFQTPRHHSQFLDAGAAWLTGDVQVRTGDIPILLRADARPKDLVYLEELYAQAIEYPFVPSIKRISGPAYPGAAFGTTEMRVIRKRLAASKSVFDFSNPDMSAVLDELVARGWKRTKKLCPDLYDAMDSAPKARAEWRIRDTPFTSGVINASAAIPYHRDRGNVANSGSVMWVARKLVDGGHLHIPELNVVVDCRHGTLLVFYGEIFWHGVTVIKGLSRARAGRFSVVAYSKKSILNAKSPQEEHYEAALRGTRLADKRRDTVLEY